MTPLSSSKPLSENDLQRLLVGAQKIDLKGRIARDLPSLPEESSFHRALDLLLREKFTLLSQREGTTTTLSLDELHRKCRGFNVSLVLHGSRLWQLITPFCTKALSLLLGQEVYSVERKRASSDLDLIVLIEEMEIERQAGFAAALLQSLLGENWRDYTSSFDRFPSLFEHSYLARLRGKEGSAIIDLLFRSDKDPLSTTLLTTDIQLDLTSRTLRPQQKEFLWQAIIDHTLSSIALVHPQEERLNHMSWKLLIKRITRGEGLRDTNDGKQLQLAWERTFGRSLHFADKFRPWGVEGEKNVIAIIEPLYAQEKHGDAIAAALFNAQILMPDFDLAEFWQDSSTIPWREQPIRHRFLRKIRSLFIEGGSSTLMPLRQAISLYSLLELYFRSSFSSNKISLRERVYGGHSLLSLRLQLEEKLYLQLPLHLSFDHDRRHLSFIANFCTFFLQEDSCTLPTIPSPFFTRIRWKQLFLWKEAFFQENNLISWRIALLLELLLLSFPPSTLSDKLWLVIPQLLYEDERKLHRSRFSLFQQLLDKRKEPLSPHHPFGRSRSWFITSLLADPLMRKRKTIAEELFEREKKNLSLEQFDYLLKVIDLEKILSLSCLKEYILRTPLYLEETLDHIDGVGKTLTSQEEADRASLLFHELLSLLFSRLELFPPRFPIQPWISRQLDNLQRSGARKEAFLLALSLHHPVEKWMERLEERDLENDAERLILHYTASHLEPPARISHFLLQKLLATKSDHPLLPKFLKKIEKFSSLDESSLQHYLHRLIDLHNWVELSSIEKKIDSLPLRKELSLAIEPHVDAQDGSSLRLFFSLSNEESESFHRLLYKKEQLAADFLLWLERKHPKLCQESALLFLSNSHLPTRWLFYQGKEPFCSLDRNQWQEIYDRIVKFPPTLDELRPFQRTIEQLLQMALQQGLFLTPLLRYLPPTLKPATIDCLTEALQTTHHEEKEKIALLSLPYLSQLPEEAMIELASFKELFLLANINPSHLSPRRRRNLLTTLSEKEQAYQLSRVKIPSPQEMELAAQLFCSLNVPEKEAAALLVHPVGKSKELLHKLLQMSEALPPPKQQLLYQASLSEPSLYTDPHFYLLFERFVTPQDPLERMIPPLLRGSIASCEERMLRLIELLHKKKCLCDLYTIFANSLPSFQRGDHPKIERAVIDLEREPKRALELFVEEEKDQLFEQRSLQYFEGKKMTFTDRALKKIFTIFADENLPLKQLLHIIEGQSARQLLPYINQLQGRKDLSPLLPLFLPSWDFFSFPDEQEGLFLLLRSLPLSFWNSNDCDELLEKIAAQLALTSSANSLQLVVPVEKILASTFLLSFDKQEEQLDRRYLFLKESFFLQAVGQKIYPLNETWIQRRESMVVHTSPSEIEHASFQRWVIELSLFLLRYFWRGKTVPFLPQKLTPEDLWQAVARTNKGSLPERGQLLYQLLHRTKPQLELLPITLEWFRNEQCGYLLLKAFEIFIPLFTMTLSLKKREFLLDQIKIFFTISSSLHFIDFVQVAASIDKSLREITSGPRKMREEWKKRCYHLLLQTGLYRLRDVSRLKPFPMANDPFRHLLLLLVSLSKEVPDHLLSLLRISIDHYFESSPTEQLFSLIEQRWKRWNNEELSFIHTFFKDDLFSIYSLMRNLQLLLKPNVTTFLLAKFIDDLHIHPGEITSAMLVRINLFLYISFRNQPPITQSLITPSTFAKLQEVVQTKGDRLAEILTTINYNSYLNKTSFQPPSRFFSLVEDVLREMILPDTIQTPPLPLFAPLFNEDGTLLPRLGRPAVYICNTLSQETISQHLTELIQNSNELSESIVSQIARLICHLDTLEGVEMEIRTTTCKLLRKSMFFTNLREVIEEPTLRWKWSFYLAYVRTRFKILPKDDRRKKEWFHQLFEELLLLSTMEPLEKSHRYPLFLLLATISYDSLLFPFFNEKWIPSLLSSIVSLGKELFDPKSDGLLCIQQFLSPSIMVREDISTERWLDYAMINFESLTEYLSSFAIQRLFLILDQISLKSELTRKSSLESRFKAMVRRLAITLFSSYGAMEGGEQRSINLFFEELLPPKFPPFSPLFRRYFLEGLREATWRKYPSLPLSAFAEGALLQSLTLLFGDYFTESLPPIVI